MHMLETAINIAVTAHRGQTDKAGQPYILHPLRLMRKCASETEQIVAVLHDVIEDTKLTSADLKQQGFSEEVRRALDCLTKVKGESYADFIDRVSQNQLATRVKILDLIDNMDCSRLRTFGEADAARMQRYANALVKLRSNTAAQTS